MKTTLIRRAALLLLLSTINFQPSTASAQGTAFTYQGHLNDAGGPANGTYDLTFALFAANSGGVPIAASVTNSATTVSNGLFAVTIDFGGAFDGTARWLEIGVRTNAGGAFTTLTPRQPLTPAPYAVFAGGASAAGLTGTIPAGNIASGSISASQLASGAAVSNLNASGLAGVASGGTILSASNNSTALLNAGYVKIGVIQSGDIWQPQTGGTPPSVRYSHTAVWTGGEMIVWGGFNGTPLNDGGRFNPSSNGGLGSWTSLASATGPSPAARFEHTAVWTGTEMIVWGGSGASSFLNDGGRYNPTANSWTAVTTTAAPRRTRESRRRLDRRRNDRLGRRKQHQLLCRWWPLQSCREWRAGQLDITCKRHWHSACRAREPYRRLDRRRHDRLGRVERLNLLC